MTEAEWLDCSAKLESMLAHLGRTQKAKSTGIARRRLRLFACACARQVWSVLPADSRFRQWVELAERVGEGLLPKKELAAAREDGRYYTPPANQAAQEVVEQICVYTCAEDASHAAH